MAAVTFGSGPTPSASAAGRRAQRPEAGAADFIARDLRIALFRFTLLPVQPLLVPAVNKGNMLRGGFGHAFRRLCCVPQCRDARDCPVGAPCPYKAIFEPSPPPGAESLSKNQDIPRPFVFRAPLNTQTRFEPGCPFVFELVLIGSALDFLPYFVLSFRELAAKGLGLNRARCILDRVEQVNAPSDRPGPQDRPTEVIYTSEDQLFRAAKIATADDWINRLQNASSGEDDGATQRLTIRFLTPTLLRADGQVIHRPEFHHVFKRLRDRINALSTFFGGGPLNADFAELGRRAEKVRTISTDVRWSERSRTSSKTGQRHELSGFVGEATYQGQLTEFLPWLILGEFVHVGKHTAWGMGGYYMQRFNASSV
jgi:hypothetical protein